MNGITILLAARSDRVQGWYQDLVRDRRFHVLSYATSADELAQRAMMQPDVLVLDAGLYDGPQVMVEALGQLPVRTTYVLLPVEASAQAKATAAAAPSVVKVWKGEVPMSTVANAADEALAERDDSLPQEQRRTGPGPAVRTPARTVLPRLARSQASETAHRGTTLSPRSVVFWSGPAGGTGRTTLALVSAIQAVEWGADAALLALSEPSVSAMLPVSRVPNALTFLEGQQPIQSVEQSITWQAVDGSQAALPVILGPPRPQDGATVDGEQVSALAAAVRKAHRLVLIDLPALVPGENVWTRTLLQKVTDIVLVIPPIAPGTAAAVEALVTLEELQAAARVYLVINRRMPDGLSAQHLVDGVKSIWGNCPEVTTEVPYLSQLPGLSNQGALPDSETLTAAIGPLVEAATGIERPEEDVDSEITEHKQRSERPAKPSARRQPDRPRLIRIRLK